MNTNLISTVLENVNGGSFVGLDTMTVVPLKGGKKNPMQGRVTKVTRGSSVMVFTNKAKNGYQEMVKRRLAEEGKDPESFVLGQRVWGERIDGTPFVAHKDKKYLEAIFLRAGKSQYLLDGQPIAKEAIVGLEEKSEGAQGGLENKVAIRTYDLESIIGIRADGVEISQ